MTGEPGNNDGDGGANNGAPGTNKCPYGDNFMLLAAFFG